MGRAFEATQGELAEKLFAALKAGDDAGGDSRGKQSASMLVVRKGGGRNLNNDRYIYINVDDNPAPIPELRRLLDINLGWVWMPRVGQLMSANKPKEAREAAAKVVQYMPSANALVALGVADYHLGDKPAALADFRKALQMDSNVKRQFDSTAAPQTGRGQRLRAVLEDKEFLKQLFPE
jgi:tetratricopeptide (TPR) repeat protein